MPISPPRRLAFLGLTFDTLTIDDMLSVLTRRSADDHYRFVVTPNVDHVVRAHSVASDGDATLMPLYRAANWCLCDSRILARLALLCGISLPVVPGSDLTRRLLAETCCPGDRLAIVGGSDAMLRPLRASYPTLDLVHHQPPMGLRHDGDAQRRAVDFVVATRARLTLLAVGSPQQEMIAHLVAERPEARGTALCVGASLDFLAGIERRAPGWIQQLGMEWAYRLAANPRRMWRRYLIEGPKIFALTWRWWRHHG